jgi:NitT/TauT family transport system substrate-binding protein
MEANTMQRPFRRIVLASLLLLPGLVMAPLARAESNQVRIVMPYGLAYLPTYVAVDGGLIEKHAKAAGLDDIKVTLVHMASGPASSDLLLSGDADIAMGGFGPAFILWDKTRGAGKVRIVTPQSSSPIWLLTNDPRIQSIRDFGPNDRIAVSAIKVTAQALALEMAAAKEWGWDQRFR